MRTSTAFATSVAAIVAVCGVSVTYSQTGQPGQTGGSTSQQSSTSDQNTTSSDQGTTSGSGSRSRSASAASSEPTSGRTESPTSQEFVTRAAQSNFAEIEVSKLAQTKAQSPEVKEFAKRMVDDHTQANSELAQLAKTKNLRVPDEPDMMHKASMKLLQTKSGDNFDAAYMEQMNKDHEKAVALFQSASSSPNVDKDLQAFAGKVLPKLRDHHELAMQTASKVGGSAAKR